MTEKRGVVIHASAARTGGGASRVNELAQTLTALAPEREFLFVLHPALAARLRDLPSGARVVVVPNHLRFAPLRAFWEQVGLPRLIAESGLDWVLSPFNVLPLATRNQGVRKAVIVSSILPLAKEMWRDLSPYQVARVRALRELTLRSVAAADRIFVLSGEATRRLEHVTPAKITFLPMAPPSPAAIQAAAETGTPDVAGTDPFFLAVGDLIPYKGFEDAIRATTELARKGAPVRLLICGNPFHPPYARRLYALARESPGGSVRFLTGLTQVQVLALMRLALGTLVCSRFENTSRVPVEAMAVGSPIVAADVPSSRETVGDAALYYEAGMASALAGRMTELLSDDRTRVALLERARQRLAGRDWLVATRTILDTLDATSR